MGEVEGQIRSEELDAEREARRRLALAQVRQYPDPILRMKANDVDEIDDSVTGLVERMKGLMSEARGVGLAAPQLGILRRVLVYQAGEEEPFRALVNPRVVESGEERIADDENARLTDAVSAPSLEIALKQLADNGEQMIRHVQSLPAPAPFTARQVASTLWATTRAARLLRPLTPTAREAMGRRILHLDAATAYDHYEAMISQEGQQGLARELARIGLPMNVYTQWYWKADLHNLLGFLSLRADSHAQHEIRVYADAMLETVRAWVPETYAAFMDYRMGAATLSAGMLAVVRRMLAGEAVEQAGSGLSKREWGELMGVLGR